MGRLNIFIGQIRVLAALLVSGPDQEGRHSFLNGPRWQGLLKVGGGNDHFSSYGGVKG